jgi:C1A family cysteine protease
MGVKTKKFGGDPEFAKALKEAQKYLHSNDFDLSDLPTNFSWEDFMGFDFTPQVKDQRACGSCYAIASTSMLEARIRLHYGQDRSLSSQFTLQCNYMTEGCSGGWGIF